MRLIRIFLDEADCHVQILGTVVVVVLLGEDKAGVICVKVLVYLDFSAFLDNVAEGQEELLFVVFALEDIHGFHGGILLQECLAELIQFAFDLLELRALDTHIGVTAAEEL